MGTAKTAEGGADMQEMTITIRGDQAAIVYGADKNIHLYVPERVDDDEPMPDHALVIAGIAIFMGLDGFMQACVDAVSEALDQMDV